MSKVSIIIPIYNAENYLHQCLDSVINQTLKDIEIICVNDGSTDSSAEILKNYAKEDNRIKVVYKENGGLVAARKTGINLAQGKYIGYVDSDDWIEPNMYEDLYVIAEHENVDLVTSEFLKEGNYTTRHGDSLDEGGYRGEDVAALLSQAIYKLEEKKIGISGSLCTKLFYRKKFLEVQNKIPDALTFAEDKMCVLAYLLRCENVYIAKKVYYHYRVNNISMTNTSRTDYLLAVNEVYQFLQTLYTHPRFTSEMRKQAELYVTELLIMGINTRMGFENRNLLWIDPYWLDQLPRNSKVVLYGAGELGRKYKKHLSSRKDCTYIACIDSNPLKNTTEDFPVLPVEQLLELDFDYVVITIKNPTKAEEVKAKLETMIPKNKILWFEQPEIFWKYAEADGLL